MGHSPATPRSGAGGGAFSPSEAKKFFEFFSVGTHREVVLLGDLVEQPVHYVRSKGHKVLCAARVGPCPLCELAAHDGDTSTQQVEYYAPAYVRTWREREFHQRVAVFSEAAGLQLLAILAGGPHRGRRIEVQRKSQGTSPRFKIEAKDGMPGGFPAALPSAFDLVPFVRARYGLRQTPDRPLVLLPSFKCEPAGVAGPVRPRALGLSADDCKLSDEDIAKFRNYVRGKAAQAEQPDPTAAIPAVMTPPPAADSKAAAAEVSDVPPELAAIAAKQRAAAAAADASGPRLATLGDDPFTVEGNADRMIFGRAVERGPRLTVRPAIEPDAEAEDRALRHGAGKLVCDEYRNAPCLTGTAKPHANGQANGPAGKGGAK